MATGGMGYRGYGVQGYGPHRQWVTLAMGHMGNGAHGQGDPWARGPMGKGAHGPMGDLDIFAYNIINNGWILTKI